MKKAGVTLELMTDIDMFQFIEKGVRCGVSYITQRHSEANKYLIVMFITSFHISDIFR